MINNPQLEQNMKKSHVKAIAQKLNDSMVIYTDSRQPTDDEVSIACLLCHIKDLEKQIKKEQYDRLAFAQTTINSLTNAIEEQEDNLGGEWNAP